MKKMFMKSLLVTFALVVIISSSVLTVSAAEPVVAVASSDFQVRQGDTFTTTIFIPDKANIIGFEITLNYDTDIMTLVQAEEHEDIKGALEFNTTKPGEIIINYGSTSNNVRTYLPLLNLTFTVDENVGIGSYDCLTVNQNASNSAHRLTGTNTISPVDFTCDFAELVIYEMGDVDLGGSLNIADAIYIRRHLAKIDGAVLEGFKLSMADTYYDGQINIADAIALQRHLARLDVVYGDRVNLTFVDKDGVTYAKKSVVYNGTLSNIPNVPSEEGLVGGVWSLSAVEFIEPVFTNITEDAVLYAYYDATNQTTEALEYYKTYLTDKFYSGDLPTNMSSDLDLVRTVNYQKGYYASLVYSSDCNYVLNQTTGAFTKPTYPQSVTMSIKIISYDADNAIEGEDRISFTYEVPGMFITPTKAEIAEWLKNYFTDDTDGKYRVNFDVNLISNINGEVIPTNGGRYDDYEVRLDWFQNINGTFVPISKIERKTSTQENDYVAIATFNGKPLEDDGKIYIDNVQVTAIEEIEIRNYIINQIAANMGTLATDGTKLWNNDTVYGSKVNWETGDPTIAYVANGEIKLKEDAISGSVLPLNARVSYAVDGGAKEFVLSYNLTVSCDNTIIKYPENMDEELYRAIKTELEEELGYRGDLTSAALSSVKFVNLDLSAYPDITSLRGLSYCVNLRTLNISGLKITDGTMNQIATLSYLEAFIARGCGLDNLSDGGSPTLKNATKLRMIDLTDNNFESLDSVFAEGLKYGQLREVYVSNNKLKDIDALSRAPLMEYLSLSNNGLTTEDTKCLANFPILTYLSLADNNIDSVEHLKGLRLLRELRLHNNNISNVNDLRRLIHLEALYLGNNQIKDIGFLNTLTKLKVLYVNDNEIVDVSNLTALTALEAVNVNNNKVSSLSVLNNYKSTLTEIYAENNKLTDFSFISGATKLHILMLAGNNAELAQTNMTSWLTGLTGLEVLTLSDIKLTDLSFLTAMPELVRLDVANCGLGAFTGGTSNIDCIASCYSKLRILDISNNDMAGSENELLKLRDLALLTVFYADNVCDDLDVANLTYSMPDLKYISMENCGIDSLSWLFKYNALAYVDLAGNDISSVTLETDISNASMKTLKELYLDTNVPCTFADAYRVVDFNVEKLSLAGISVKRMEYLPYLDNIRYLNLSNTGLTNLIGDDSELADLYSIGRCTTVEVIDVSNLEIDISPIEDLPNVKTVYAVGTADSELFHEGNLHALQRMHNLGVECYLYDKQTAYEPVATTEGPEILALLENIPETVMVAADNVFSDNNPVLVDEINDFDIAWTVSNADNYEIVDNHLSVKDYTGIDDEELTITAQITVYPDQAPVTREFKINTKILRASAEYFETDATGYSKQLTRDKTFTFDLKIKASQTADFANPVKPVVDYIAYDYSASSGIPYVNILTVGENHRYSISSNAPLNETVTIKINVGHITKDGTRVNDVEEITAPVTVVSRTFTVTVVLNGGQLVDGNGVARDTYECVEDSLIFEGMTVQKTGYLFEGWYLDAELNQRYSLDGSDAVMPSENLTLYAKWKAHSFNLLFDANGGSVSETSRLVLCDTAVGTLPTPTRTGYTFGGWFTSDGKQITASSSMATAADITVTAKWTVNSYKVSWTDGDGYSIVVKRTSSPNASAAIGTLSNNATVYYGDVLSVTYTKDDYWSISKQGATSITVTGNVTSSSIYATATWNPVSSWVKASEVPSGAQIVNRKWSYTKTTNTESRETSMAGYTQVGSYWVESGRGSQNYASFPSGFNQDHSIYTSFAKNAVSGYENATSKRVVTNRWGGYVYWHWMYNVYYRNTTERAISSQKGTFNGLWYGYFYAFTSSVNCPYLDKYYCNSQNLPSYNCNSILPASTGPTDGMGTPRFFRFDYYVSDYVDYYKMFKYQKVENLESTTQVAASDTISNVVEWVQYRAK